MAKSIIRYLLAFAFLSLIGIVTLDYIILPNYVGYDNEHYLPDVRGEYLEKAIYTLNSLGFQIEVVTIPFSKEQTPEMVIKMFPRAFTKVKEGRTINLTVAGDREELIIPNLINTTLRNAKLSIRKLGLGIDTVIYEYNSEIKEDAITFQLPKAGKLVNSSAKITLGVSRGNPPDYYLVPDVVNLSLRKGEIVIINSGLRVGDISYEYQPELINNTIIEQNMTAGMRVSIPAAIDLLVSTDSQILP